MARLRISRLSRPVALLLVATILPAFTPAWSAQVSVDTSVEHQTIIGWGAVTPWLMDVPDDLAARIIDVGANDLGLTRLRFEGPGGNKAEGRRWEWENDDNDPMHINWSAFNTADFDEKVTKYIVPFKQAVEATGAPFNIYLSPSFFDNGSSGEAPVWLLRNPGEYVEFAMASLLRLRSFGIDADHYVILNEPGNGNAFYSAVLGRMIRALGPRMAAEGFPTGIQFPESINAYAGWTTIQALANDEMVWRYINMLSYHLYGGTDYRDDYRDFGLARGLPTAQTEYMSMTIKTLYDDMVDAGTSVWEVYGQGFPGPDIARTSFTRSTYFWDFRQVMHYVRPGAVRVDANSDNSTVKSLAFVDDGEVTVVLINYESNSTAQTVNISGLPAGEYSVSQSISHGLCQQLGLQTVDVSGELSISLPKNAVLTISPHNSGNLPPEINTCETADAFLKSGISSTTQLLVSAVDPELDALSYEWSLLSCPAGANVIIGNPNSAASLAFGLTVPGEYAFNVTVSDAYGSDTSEAHIKVFDGNQPPLLMDVHNRKPVKVTLPVNYTLLRSAAQDLEGRTLSYLWTIISQPAGADAQLANPTYGACDVTAMDVPGDYVFRITVSDSESSSYQDLTIPVYPANDNAPYVNTVSAAVMPSGRGKLTARTGDTDGDGYSRWWELVSQPAGANAYFTTQASDSTLVSVDTAGAYQFRMIVTDRSKYSQSSTYTLSLSPTEPLTAGDANQDGSVNLDDFILLKQNYGSSSASWSSGDFNGDGSVNLDDFILLKQNYGS